MKKLILPLSLFTASLFLQGCSNEDPKSSLDYLALGDSYTIGQSLDISESWPLQLSEKLNDYNVKTEVIAKTGWSTGKLLDTLDNTKLKKYDLVSLLIGVNNQFWGNDLPLFKSEFDQLLDLSIMAARNGNKGVFIVSIPDYGVTPFGKSKAEQIAEDIDEYNDYIEGKCLEKNVVFVNITGISRDLGDSEQALSFDLLHPSEYQYSQWVDLIYPAVLQILEE